MNHKPVFRIYQAEGLGRITWHNQRPPPVARTGALSSAKNALDGGSHINGLRVSGKPRCPARRDGHPARSLRTRPPGTNAHLGVTKAGP